MHLAMLGSNAPQQWHGRTDGRTNGDAWLSWVEILAFSDAHAQARGGLIFGRVTT